MSELNEPVETTGQTKSGERCEQELSSSEKACLVRIEKMREETVQEKDHLSAALTAFAATNMEIDLQYQHEIRRIICNRTQLLHEIPELPLMFANHFGLARQYHRDLDLAQRYRQSQRKGDNDHRQRTTQSGI